MTNLDEKKEVVAWIGFDFDGDSGDDNEYIKAFYGEYDKPKIG